MEDEREQANLKTHITPVTLASLQRFNLEHKYQIRQKISQGGFGLVFKVLRKADHRVMAAKCIPLDKINEDSELLKTYVEREMSFLTSLSCSFIMKLEDSCFVSGPTSAVQCEHLVILSELAQENLEDYIKK